MSLVNPDQKTVVLTGFGPFRSHDVNASWEALKLLPGIFDSEKLGIALVIEQIPVEYEETINRLSALRKKHHPILMIHVGVSAKAKELTLEACASKNGYNQPDVQGKTPMQEECSIGQERQIATNLNVEKLAAQFNSLKIGVNCCTSDNAGLYLCEFSYYTSLCLTEKNSLFIHVPDIGKPYTPEETAQGIRELICLAVAQIEKSACIGQQVFDSVK